MGNMGLFWIPATIAVQVLLLYSVLGGPSRLLARLAGDERLVGATVLNKVQIGLPLALVLAFPALVTLALLERLLGKVGILELVVVESGFLLLLLRILQRRQRAAEGDREFSDMQAPLAGPESPQAVMAAGNVDSVVVADTHREHAVAREVLSGSPTMPMIPTPVAPPWGTAAALDGPRVLLNRLNRIYLWDDIGAEGAFVEARRRPSATVLSSEEIAELGSATFACLRAVVHDTLRSLGSHERIWHEDDFSPERVLEVEEYQRDVMRRLVLSVWSDCERLYVDRTDVEMCGKRKLLLMYRIALAELAPYRFGQAAGSLH